MTNLTGEAWIKERISHFSDFSDKRFDWHKRLSELDRELSQMCQCIDSWKEGFCPKGFAYAKRYAKELEKVRRSLLVKVFQGGRSK